jgi:hypothetical protein
VSFLTRDRHEELRALACNANEFVKRKTTIGYTHGAMERKKNSSVKGACATEKSQDSMYEHA